MVDHSLVRVDLRLGGLEVRVGAQHRLRRVVQASLTAALATSVLAIAENRGISVQASLTVALATSVLAIVLNRGKSVVYGEGVSRVQLIRGVRVRLGSGKFVQLLFSVCIVVHEWVGELHCLMVKPLVSKREWIQRHLSTSGATHRICRLVVDWIRLH